MTRAERSADGRLVWEPRAGDVVRLRRAHACGERRMVVTRVGLDVRVSCCGCGAPLSFARARLRSRVADVVGTIQERPELRGAALEPPP